MQFTTQGRATKRNEQYCTCIYAALCNSIAGKTLRGVHATHRYRADVPAPTRAYTRGFAHVRCNRTHWKQLLVKFTIINSRQHVMTSCTWRSVASSDDVNLYEGWMTMTSNTRVMLEQPAASISPGTIIPLSSKTVGVSDTGVKTLLQRCRRVGHSVRAFWLRMNDPARWTVGVDRWCRINVTVIWLTQDK